MIVYRVEAVAYGVQEICLGDFDSMSAAVSWLANWMLTDYLADKYTEITIKKVTL